MTPGLRTLVAATLLLAASCTHRSAKLPEPAPDDRYPAEISRIIISRCATAGCHNSSSFTTSGGGLRLDTWEHLFDGGNTGAAIVAFSPENSPLLYFTNSFEDLGPLPPQEMHMPLNNPPLSREEYLTLRNWVLAGAPDKDGNIPFASNAAGRQKVYLAHQGCDYIYVIDAEKNVVMRTISTSQVPTIEAAYALRVSSDGYAYTSLWGGSRILRMDTRTDSLIDEIELGYPNSNAMVLAPDNKSLIVSNQFMKSALHVRTDTRQVTAMYGTNLHSPHGVAANRSFDTFFVTEQQGNTVYRIPQNGTPKKISIDGLPPSTSQGGPGPYSILMAPDHSRYFLTCQGTNEVRVMDAHTDTLIQVIPVGKTPRELALSLRRPYLFVSCPDDPSAIPVYKGSVYIINYNTLETVAVVKDRFYLPHALAVDDQYGKLFVFSRNIDPDGPQPHHGSSSCEGRNGYYSVYDFFSLQPLNNKRYEVSVDPFAADVRFK